jgi:hypothetical protein
MVAIIGEMFTLEAVCYIHLLAERNDQSHHLLLELADGFGVLMKLKGSTDTTDY